MFHRVGYQQKIRPSRQACYVPSLLAIYDAVFTKDRMHVFKYPFGIFKCNAMFNQIGLCLLAVPFKPRLPTL
jgi:hypothetical protein